MLGDGVPYATGCTFGKGNIRKLGYGRFVMTLINNKAELLYFDGCPSWQTALENQRQAVEDENLACFCILPDISDGAVKNQSLPNRFI